MWTVLQRHKITYAIISTHFSGSQGAQALTRSLRWTGSYVAIIATRPFHRWLGSLTSYSHLTDYLRARLSRRNGSSNLGSKNC